MTSNRRQGRSILRTVLRGGVAATLVGALATAGAMSFAQASPTVQPAIPGVSAVAAGPTVAELIPAPPLPARVVPDLPLPTPEPGPAETASSATGSSEAPADHCGDAAWWNARQVGDPGDHVAACGTWPSWIDRGGMPCLPGEQDCDPATTGAFDTEAYDGPTEGRAWSPEYGYYEGRTDGPKNSSGEPCMQGRDNNDPNC
ncbi:hypothetical protein EV383_0050 [Pseudonocardia sediminis]|uniref:Uncharacterized protein n=1 Tax=Pseudonocardia sediminis TaxID=1397368 RepID=A0A4Q7URD8_PSEST|nr:hypothetical protein [Pseudonocardia sediminis]RZT83251.1 hypothetical protein EV383_0050 [Pseudonocardia sediminis]